MKDELGNRMKDNYESRSKIKLLRKTPVIIRLDGKAFHSLKLEKPFDDRFKHVMVETAKYLFDNVQGCKFAYTQSDEISLLLLDDDNLNTDAWFDWNVQKLTSVSASMASVVFNNHGWNTIGVSHALFDSRAFNIPDHEVLNYFRWRYMDWVRNSVSMLAQAHYSHKELHKKSQSDMHEMLHEKGINWANLDPSWKNGTMIYRKGRETKTEGDFNFNDIPISIFWMLYIRNVGKEGE